MIGFVNICHADYVNEAVEGMAQEAVKGLRAEGIAIHAIPGPVTDHRSALIAGTELLREGVDGVILFLGTWIECSTAMAFIREIEHLPMCLWGFGMFMDMGALSSTGSYVSFAMFKGTMDRAGYRYKPVLGLPQDSLTVQRACSFARAASCAGRLKRVRIGLVGYTSMSIYPGTFDHLLMRVRIGPEIEQSDSYSLINRAEGMSERDCDTAVAHIGSLARLRNDVDPDALRKTAKVFLALRQLCAEQDLDAVNVKCQYEFSKEYKSVVCVPLSALAEEGVVSSCEGDMLNTVSMVILHLLSGQIVTYGDAMNHEDNVLKLSSCGFAPFSLGKAEDREIRKFMPHPGFTGIQTGFALKPGRVTVMRLIEDRNDYHILFFTGEGLETGLRQGYMPALDVRLDGDVNRLVENYAGQHFAICYGDRSQEIEDLARILGIRTIRI